MARNYKIVDLECVRHAGLLAVFNVQQKGQTLCNFWLKTGSTQADKQFFRDIHLEFPAGRKNPQLPQDRQQFEYRCTPEVEEYIRLLSVEEWSRQQAKLLKAEQGQALSFAELVAWRKSLEEGGGKSD